MAGLGQDVKSEFSMRARMNGFTDLGGTPVQLWFFDESLSNRGFMADRFLPSAHLEMRQGEMVNLAVSNQSSMDHTVHLHGMDVDQANDGVATTSQAIPPFGNFTYQFIAPFAGTYHYHCHIDTVVHYHRGMAGAIIVRPPGGELNLAWDGGPTFDEEVLWHFSTYDLDWETEQVSSAITARHRPSLFLLNGKDGTEAVFDPFTKIFMRLNQVCYLRVVNQAYQFARFRLGGLPFQIVASDGRPLPKPITTDTWEIGTGERYDVLLSSSKPFAGYGTIDYLDDYSGKVLGQVSTAINIGTRTLPSSAALRQDR